MDTQKAVVILGKELKENKMDVDFANLTEAEMKDMVDRIIVQLKILKQLDDQGIKSIAINGEMVYKSK